MAKSRQTVLSWVVIRSLLVWLLAATALVAPHCAADEKTDYRGLKFSVATGGDAVLLPVRFAGRDFLFMFDTGSPETIFDESFREKLGDPLRSARMQTPIGDAWVTTFSAPPATIAGRPLAGVAEVRCADLSLARSVLGHEIYGALGMDFLRDRRVRIDFDAGVLMFLESVPDDSGEPVALSYSARHGGVTARLGVEGAGQQGFVIDTGWVGVGDIEVTLFERMLRGGSATAVGDGKAVSLGSQAATRRRARLAELTLGRFRHSGLVFSEGTRSALGTLYLSRYVLTFDFPAMTMYVKPGARFNGPNLRDLSGLMLWRPDVATVVHSVADGSVAQRAGLMADDVIERIGSRAATSMSMFEIRKLFAMPGRHTLRVVRGGETLDAVLILEETPLPAGR